MKRALRSAASKSDAENDHRMKIQKKSPIDPKPQRNRKDKISKENKENATTRSNKSVRRILEPLQENNSDPVVEQNNKVRKTSSSVDTNDTDKLSANSSKKTIRKKVVEDVEHVEKNVVNQPKPHVALTETKEPLSTSSVTTRKNKQSKNASSQMNREKSTETAEEMIASTSKNASSKKTAAKTTKPLVPFTTKTRSRLRSVEGSMPKSVLTMSPSKPVVASTVATRSSKRNNVKSSHTSNVTARRNERKKSPTSGPDENSEKSNTQYVTTRKNRQNIEVIVSHEPKNDKTKAKEPAISNVTKRKLKAATDSKSEVKEPAMSNVTKRQPKAANDNRKKDEQGEMLNVTKRQPKSSMNDKPEITEPLHSNVTTRRRALTKLHSNQEKEVSEISRNKRSQSVHRATNGREMDTNSNLETIDVLAPLRKKQKTVHKADTRCDRKVTKQPELLTNRSNASDSSDQSNSSTLPIYKRVGNSNNNVLDSVFEFESNSQDNTLENDEEMKKVLAKLVSEKKASVVKKRKGKGATKANATRSKKIEKIRSDLNELKKLNATAVRAAKAIPKLQAKTSPNVKNIVKTTQDNVTVVDLVETDFVNLTSNESPQNNEFPLDTYHSREIEDVVAIDVDDSGMIQPPLNPSRLEPTTNETPPQQFKTTYKRPGNTNTAVYQSTPVRIEMTGNSSPWRYNQNEVKYTDNVFSRYSELEKSPIKSVNITTKPSTETKSPTRKRLPLATNPISDNVQEIEKPKILLQDIRNGFGFLDDDDDDEDENPSLTPVEDSLVSLTRKVTTTKSTTKKTSPKKPTTPGRFSALLRLPQALNSLREKVNLLRSTKQPPAPSDVLKQPKSKTQSTISSHFGDTKITNSTQRSKKRQFTTNKNKVETITRTKEISETETTTTSYANNDACSLFDSTFPEDKPHRSYSRVTKRDHKKQQNSFKNILSDDESEFGDTIMQKRTKRSKPKDDKHQEQLEEFTKSMNSEFKDVEDFELIMERSA